jgi:hypothetical protein
MKQVVIGAGQVGRAIAEVLESAYDVDLVDIDSEYVPSAEETVIHICFPWGPKFEQNVREYQSIYQPVLTIIHSTVPVGTSRRLGAVHSPVTGRHPDLAESIFVFVKFFGGKDAQKASDVFMPCRGYNRAITTQVVPDQETTEAGKLWQTLQYGWIIALQKEGYAWMKSVGADPRVAYEDFNRVYTDGYDALGGYEFSLPIIKDMVGPIGGHCVIPNTELTDHSLAQLLRIYNMGWQEDSPDENSLEV